MNKVVINDFAPLADKYAEITAGNSTPCQSIGDLLNINKRELINYASLTGQGINLLDFELEFAAEGDNIGYVSSACSDNLKNFENPIIVYINLDEKGGSFFSAPGITFHFWKNFCTKMTVIWWRCTDKSMVVTSRKEIFPNSLDYYFENPVEEFNFIQIVFEKTEIPYQFVKLAGIDLGKVREITDFHSNIEIFAEIETDCADVPGSTCDFVAEITDFKPQDMQELYVYGGKSEKLFGKFIIDRVSSIGRNRYSFECSDEIVKMEYSPYPQLSQGVRIVSELTDEIKENSNIPIDCGTYADTEVEGFIEEDKNARFAVAMISFGIGCFFSGFGHEKLRFFKPKNRRNKFILSSQILGRAEYIPNSPYSELIVKKHYYKFDNAIVAREEKFYERRATYINKPLIFDKYSLMIDIDKRVSEIKEAGSSRSEIIARILYEDEALGDICYIETPYDGLKKGIIKSLDISIGNRITATVKMIERDFTSSEE